MTDQNPTTINGPLHTPEADLDDRRMEAAYSNVALAEAARDRLIEAGIAADRIRIVDKATESANIKDRLAPDDKGIVARVREALMPEDSNAATRDAAKSGDAILTLQPARADVERVIGIIEASHPSHFDASLERWRNIG